MVVLTMDRLPANSQALSNIKQDDAALDVAGIRLKQEEPQAQR